MAQERIEIKFIPTGDRPLIQAIKKLHKETAKLNGQLNKLNKVNIKVAQTQDLVSKRVSANTAAVHANSTAWTRLQSVVAVYRNKLPKYQSFKTGNYIYKYPVLDADTSDLRFNDPGSYICGLKAKGKAKKDDSGFVLDTNIITI